MKPVTLDNLKEYYEEQEYDCIVRDPDEMNAYPGLVVYFGMDAQDRMRSLVLTLTDQVPQDKLLEGWKPEDVTRYSLEFLVQLPFDVKAEGVADTARFLSFVNHGLPIPGFVMDEIERKVFFKYVVLGEKDRFDYQSLKSLTGMIMMCLNLYSATIENIAKAEMTMNQFLEQMLDELKTMQETE